MAIEAGNKILWADMEAFAIAARLKVPTRAINFFGYRHVISHAVENPTVAGWLNNETLGPDHTGAGVLIGDVVINKQFPKPTQSIGGWRLTAYPWNDPSKWVRANWLIGTRSQRLASATGFRAVWFEVELPNDPDEIHEMFVRQFGPPLNWEQWFNWRTELERIQSAISTNQRFNFYTTAPFLGYSKSAMLSDRMLVQSKFIGSGAINRPARGIGTGSGLTNNEDRSVPLFSLQHEILHYGGNGAAWEMDMVPEMSHVGGLSGFRLVGSGARVRGKVTFARFGAPLQGFSGLQFPGNFSVQTGTSVQTVQLIGTMASIATYHLAFAFPPSLNSMEFHIIIDGNMPAGDCTIGANITFASGGFVTEPPQRYFPMFLSSGGFPELLTVTDPLFASVNLGNSSASTNHVSIDGRQIQSTGILPDGITCQFLTGYTPPGPGQIPKATERCDRFTYYSPNAGVLTLVNQNLLLGIGKGVPSGIAGDLSDEFQPSLFAPGFNGTSADPSDPEIEQVAIAVNARAEESGNLSRCKTIPFVKHHEDAVAVVFDANGTLWNFALVEVVVRRKPVLNSDGFYVLPTLPDHPTQPLSINVGYYEAGDDGNFNSAGIIIELAANANVARWRGLLALKTDRGLVYDCDEVVHITGLISQWDPASQIISANKLPTRAAYLIETQRLITAI